MPCSLNSYIPTFEELDLSNQYPCSFFNSSGLLEHYLLFNISIFSMANVISDAMKPLVYFDNFKLITA